MVIPIVIMELMRAERRAIVEGENCELSMAIILNNIIAQVRADVECYFLVLLTGDSCVVAGPCCICSCNAP